MSKITADDVRKVAKLARLDLPEDTIATYTGQLERILDYVDQLQAVETDGVLPTTRAVEVVNATREDIVVDTDVRQELLDQAPQREGVAVVEDHPEVVGPCVEAPEVVDLPEAVGVTVEAVGPLTIEDLLVVEVESFFLDVLKLSTEKRSLNQCGSLDVEL